MQSSRVFSLDYDKVVNSAGLYLGKQFEVTMININLLGLIQSLSHDI